MSDFSKLIILGAGGHAGVVLATSRAMGFDIEAVYDDNESIWGSNFFGVPVKGPISLLENMPKCKAVIGIGNSTYRKQHAENLDMDWQTIIHPFSYIDPTAQIGAGTVVTAGCVIHPDTTIGLHSIINTGATIDHQCHLGDYTQVAPGGNICGNVTIRSETFVGAGAVIIENLIIGCGSIIGASSVVIRNIGDHVTAVGNPARVIEQR